MKSSEHMIEPAGRDQEAGGLPVEAKTVSPVRALRGQRWLKARLKVAVAEGLSEALWLFLVLRVALSLFALMASVRFELPGPCTWEGGPELHAEGLAFRLLGVWQRWDACWYGKIATVGYQPGDVSVAFFPLYPALMRLVGFAVGGDVVVSGLVVSGVAYIAAMTGLYRLVRHDFDAHVAQRTVLYVSVFPSAFFFFVPFTEALFLALVVWTLYGARRGAWGLAAMTGLFAGLTRLQGVILALPLAWEWFRQRRQLRMAGQRLGLKDLATAAVLLLPALGFGLFLVYSQAVTGAAFFKAQLNWGQTASAPWNAIASSWEHIQARRDPIEALNLVLLLLFVVIVVAGLRRLPLVYSLYSASQLLLMGSRQAFFSPLMATSRYVLVVFPAFVVLALFSRHRRLHDAWLILSLLLLGFLLYAFLSGSFVA